MFLFEFDTRFAHRIKVFYISVNIINMDTAELLEHRTGMIAVKQGRIAKDEFYRAIKEQKKLFARERIFTPVSEILVYQKSVPAIQQKDSLLSAGSDHTKAPVITEREKKTPPLELTVTDDKLTALISFEEEAGKNYGPEDVKALLQKQGIIYGILDDDSINKAIKSAGERSFTLMAASGIEPDPGKPDQIKYFFDTNPLRVGTLTEEGTMDWKNRGKIVQVDADTLLAEIIPGKKGSPGTDVYGKEIAIVVDNQPNISCGPGVKKTEDGLNFYSTEKGQPVIRSNGIMEISPVLKIDGDVGIRSGHVDFNGHVEVSGLIQKGYKVKAKSLRAEGILDADISVENDIVIYDGIFSSKIRSDGKIKAGHIRASNIIALGDLHVERELTESTVETSGRCIVEESVFASEISAMKGIKTGNIGSESTDPSLLTVGIDFRAKRAVAALKQRIKDTTKALDNIRQNLSEFKKKTDQLNTDLGKIALVQDKYIVEHRNLIEAPEGDAVRRTELEAKIRKIDETVAGLMDEDEQVLHTIKKAELMIKKYKDEIDEHKHGINKINKKSESEKPMAIVKASGVIYPGTIINGPNASIKVAEMLHRSSISERKGSKNQTGWYMKIFT
jgi:uncharacterized protein (DUF342 family)